MDNEVELELIRRRHGAPLAPGSDLEAEALARFGRFFSDFSPARIEHLLPETYAEDVVFDDTLKTLRGRDALAHYLGESAAAVEACQVQIVDEARSDNGDYYLRWRMMIRFKRFRRGQDTWSIGMSHLRFNAEGRVVYHQDYWNAADGLFEHIPLVGHLIRAIKRRL
jgi:hypothetical protein